MEPDRWQVDAPSMGGRGEVWAYGSWGRPVVVFPSQQGHVRDIAGNGMVDAVGHLVHEGRVKLYCVATADDATWFDHSIGLEERARRYGAWSDWLYHRVVPAIVADCGGRDDLIAAGCSFGAYHAVNATLQRADLIGLAIGLSGVYDIMRIGAWGEPGEATYFANPAAYVANMSGDHLDWVRRTAHLVLCVGQGMWEDTSGALPATKAFGRLVQGKGLHAEVDLWGHDVPHDWPSWRRMFPHHLERFC